MLPVMRDNGGTIGTFGAPWLVALVLGLSLMALVAHAGLYGQALGYAAPPTASWPPHWPHALWSVGRLNDACTCAACALRPPYTSCYFPTAVGLVEGQAPPFLSTTLPHIATPAGWWTCLAGCLHTSLRRLRLRRCCGLSLPPSLPLLPPHC